MASTTEEDSRIEKIKEVQVYGLFHGPVLIYIGATTSALRIRKRKHLYDASTGGDAQVHCYIRNQVIDEDSISIEPLHYDSEMEAIEEHFDSILNARSWGKRAEYRGYEWTSTEVDVLERADNMYAAWKQLEGVNWPQVRRAGIKLGLHDEQEDKNYSNAPQLTDEEVFEICLRYHTGDIIQARLADEYDVCVGTISKAVRGESYPHVDRPDP